MSELSAKRGAAATGMVRAQLWGLVCGGSGSSAVDNQDRTKLSGFVLLGKDMEQHPSVTGFQEGRDASH